MIPRIEMPQIRDVDEFAAWAFKVHGVHSHKMHIGPFTVTMRQRKDTFVASRFRPAGLKSRILISVDRVVIDGHHRTMAHQFWRTPLPVLQMSLPFLATLSLARDFPGVYFVSEKNFV